MIGNREIGRVSRQATALINAGQLKRGVRLLTVLIEDMDDACECKSKLCAVIGKHYSDHGLHTKAKKWFKKAIKHDPTAEIESCALFHCCWELHDFAGALREARRFLNLVPDSDYFGLKEMLIREGVI
jgi:tetratricopeptide (TPR) repeat protein